ncbi:MAG: diacylglycerol kinase family lipid kinase [Dehalococcoidia bacterium]|nr:diacylglycerol kinase family lipid kinase [Dehalococcoidia bacterium]
MQAELIYNPYAGQVVVRREMEDVIALLKQRGWVVSLSETHRPMEAAQLASDAVKRGAKVVIAAGGDGTVNEVGSGLVGTDVALGVLPLGTTNVWAMQMHIPTLNPMRPGTRVAKMVAGLEELTSWPLPANYHKKMLLNAAQVLVEGRTVAIDVGEAAGRYFLMWLGIGLDAVVVKKRALGSKRLSGSLSYIVPALGTLGRYSSVDITMTLDGKVIKADSSLVVVSNIQLYGGIFPIGAKAHVNDGKLDVCIFKGGGVLTLTRHAWKVLSRQHLQDPKVEYCQCSQIVIESARPMPVHIDGDPFMETPVTIRVLPSALNVIVPSDAPHRLFAQ